MKLNRVLASQKGVLHLIDLPLPQYDRHEVMIEVVYSVMSPGTEQTIRQTTGKSGILSAAFKKLNQVREWGLTRSIKTFQKVWESYQPLGYSVAGKVVAVGADVRGIEVGDDVMATGAGYAIHAQYVCVPSIYVLPIESMKDTDAFGGVLTIGLNAYTKARPQIGDRVAVVGGGLIGQLTAQVMAAAGADVDVVEIKDTAINRLKIVGLTVVSELSGVYDHIIICANTGATFLSAQQHIAFGGTIVITGYGDLSVDRDLIESSQFKLCCTDSYGLFAGNPKYVFLGEDMLGDAFGLDTARKNLRRARYLLARIPIGGYTRIPVTDYSRIDGLLSDGAATVVIEWTS